MSLYSWRDECEGCSGPLAARIFPFLCAKCSARVDAAEAIAAFAQFFGGR